MNRKSLRYTTLIFATGCLCLLATLTFSPPNADVQLNTSTGEITRIAEPTPALQLVQDYFPKDSNEENSKSTPSFRRLYATFPQQFKDPLTIHTYKGRISVSPVNAEPASNVEIDGPKRIYKEAFPGCDAVYKITPQRVEEFLVIHEASKALNAYAWDLDLGKDGSKLSPQIQPEGSIVFSDAKNIARIIIDPPLARDASGLELSVGENLHYSISQTSDQSIRLTLNTNLSTLQFPVVIDPTWRAAPRIIDGTTVAESNFPTVGEVGDASGFFCTGTLIAPNCVLTAGHCFTDDNGTLTLTQTAGRFRLGGTVFQTTQIIVNPTYQGFNGETENQFDAIVMILSTSSGVTPSKLFRSTPTVGTSLTLVGYGEQGTGGSGRDGSFPSGGVLNFGNTPIDIVTDTFIKWNFENTTPAESNTAPGDSGGPAFIDVSSDLQLAGITSGGRNDSAGFGDVSFDTRVDQIAGWVDSVCGTSGSGNSNPFFNSVPSVSNASPNINETVTFSLAADDADGDTLTVTWDFGDGTTGSGSTTNHAYTTAGIYTAVATVTDGNGGTITGSVDLAVVEFTMTLDKANLRFKLARTFSDKAIIKAFFTLNQDITLANQTVTVNIGGLATTVTLDERERSPTGGMKVKFRIRGHRKGDPISAGAAVTVTIILVDDFISGGLKLGGISDPDITTDRFGEPATLTVTLQVGTQSYGAIAASGSYKAKEFRVGKFRLD